MAASAWRRRRHRGDAQLVQVVEGLFERETGQRHDHGRRHELLLHPLLLPLLLLLLGRNLLAPWRARGIAPATRQRRRWGRVHAGHLGRGGGDVLQRLCGCGRGLGTEVTDETRATLLVPGGKERGRCGLEEDDYI